jgi:hypothetical protein
VLGICAVAGGGAFAVVQGEAGSPATAQVANTQAAGVTGQATVLRDVLAGTGVRRLARLRRLGGLHGEYTYATAKGAATLAFERGTVTSVGGGHLVVRAADGATWTWAITGTSVVRENGTKEPESALATGQAVFAGGPVAGGTREARLIVIRKTGQAPAKTPATRAAPATA